ncbi:MAG: GAF domain-containing sensor histidine kinase [Candidatus Magnetominusculus sp. LBB02]|nr:GAF domain-containing sensor histidine kinase [Candidatus Magnetominusculus sp. LBB02]
MNFVCKNKIILPAAIAIVVIIAFNVETELPTAIDILSRYLLALPGSSMAAISFVSFVNKENEIQKAATTRTLLFAAATFTVYSIISGLIVPKGSFTPSNMLNYSAFHLFVGMPIELVSGMLALTMLASLVLLLREFNISIQKKFIDNAYHLSFINRIKDVSLQPMDFTVELGKILNIICAIRSMPVKPAASIFLIEDDPDVLVLKSQVGLEDGIIKACGFIVKDKCICGYAAETGTVMFKSVIDNKLCKIFIDGKTTKRGQYSVPISSDGNLLGVLNLYVKEGHTPNNLEKRLLSSASKILHSVIGRHNAEKRIQYIEYMRKNEVLLTELNRMADLATVSAGLSHEINNPLSFVKSSVSLIQKKVMVFDHFIRHTKSLIEKGSSLNDYKELLEQFEIDEYMALIKKKIDTSYRGIDRIMEVVNALKTFSRCDVLGVDEVNINACIDNTLAVVINRRKKVNIVKEYSELPPYTCEPTAINQCLYQVLENAKHAVSDNGTIRCSTSHIVEQGDIITIRIEDDGVGMSEDTLKKAFVPFFTTREVGSGKGLGLSIVKGILNRHGANIEIESYEGKGTSVTIRLPIICLVPDEDSF